MKEKAMVMEIKKGYCLVMTEDGDFRRLRLPQDVRLGQEVLAPAGARLPHRHILMAAAAFLVFVIGFGSYQAIMAPALAAYVSLEINPAVELAVDRQNVVRRVRPLDQDGQKLLAGIDLSGRPLSGAVDEFIRAAADSGYIRTGKDNIIVSAVTSARKGADAAPVEELVEKTIRENLSELNVSARVIVGEITREERSNAAKNGATSTGYLVEKRSGGGEITGAKKGHGQQGEVKDSGNEPEGKGVGKQERPGDDKTFEGSDPKKEEKSIPVEKSVYEPGPGDCDLPGKEAGEALEEAGGSGGQGVGGLHGWKNKPAEAKKPGKK